MNISFAQMSKLKRADKAFDELNYQEAIELYSEILSKTEVNEAKIRLAECYRKVSNTVEAEYWYGQIVNLPESESIHKLYYGMMLQTNGKCDLAKEWYKKYVLEVPDDLRGQYLVKACDYTDELMTKNGDIYEIENMPFNTNLDDFSPMFFSEGIVFSSEYQDSGNPIKRTHTWTGNPFLELYYVERNQTSKKKLEYEYSKSSEFSNRLNSRFHDAAVCFNDDQSEIYFTRNNYNGKDDAGAIRLKIYTAQKEGYVWGSLESFPFNSNEYSVAHPTLSPDGKRLFFASDMPGGFGGMDLYYSDNDNGRWGPPMNLGPGINTEGHEVFPYVSPDNRVFFASDGHVGLGGLDIYYMEIKENNQFGEINNMGHPINSTSDDFGIIMHPDGAFGYFSSDRDGGMGDDDIYSFKKMAAKMEVLVYDEKTMEPLREATVINECDGKEYTTNIAGIVFLDQKLEKCCTFSAAKEEYIGNSLEGCTKNADIGESILVEIPLKKELVFDIEGIVYDEITNQAIEGATIELQSECNKEPMTTVTDKDGKYYFKINEECCYTVKANYAPHYLATRSKEQCTKDLDKSTTLLQNIYLAPVIPTNTVASNNNTSSNTTTSTTNSSNSTFNNNTSTYPSSNNSSSSSYVTNNSSQYNSTNNSTVNTISNNNGVSTQSHNTITTQTSSGFGQGQTPGTYLLHIYYDFDQAYIRDDALPELEKLYRMLQDNPSYVLEIGSHTDSRGSYRYNQRLSQRRAESVVRWLKAKGVNSNRLISKGYGEGVNVNNCVNNIPCSEEEHQRNRRTEFKIVGYYDSNGNYTDIVKSSQPTQIAVDRCEGCPF